MKKEKDAPRTLLSGELDNCFRTGRLFSGEEDDGGWKVKGPIHVNGTEFPYHLYKHQKDAETGAFRHIRIAIDPDRKANGKKVKNPFKSPVVLAYFIAELHTPVEGKRGSVLTYDFHPVDWFASMVRSEVHD